jgi:hypothetical protein
MGTAMTEHSLGHDSKSREALDQLIAKNGQAWAYQIAEVYAWRGEKDKAFEWLQRGYDRHDGGLSNIKIDALLRTLRGDARFWGHVEENEAARFGIDHSDARRRRRRARNISHLA